MELAPGLYFVRTVQRMWLEANEKEPLASWDGPTNPIKLLLVYLLSQKVLRHAGSSRKYDFKVTAGLPGGGERNKGEELSSQPRGRR